MIFSFTKGAYMVLLERLELPFATPITDSRLEDDLGYSSITLDSIRYLL
jgi:hypothetical protein